MEMPAGESLGVKLAAVASHGWERSNVLRGSGDPGSIIERKSERIL